MRKVIPLIDRLLSRVEIIPESGCWIWMGSLDNHGYGILSSERGKAPHKTHRLSFQLFNGIIPPGLLVRHKCDIRSCCNPNHLESGTYKQNMADAISRNRLPRGLERPNAKLSKLDIRMIIYRAVLGDLYKDIARDFGISRGHAGDIALSKGVRRHGIYK